MNAARRVAALELEDQSLLVAEGERGGVLEDEALLVAEGERGGALEDEARVGTCSLLTVAQSSRSGW